MPYSNGIFVPSRFDRSRTERERLAALDYRRVKKGGTVPPVPPLKWAADYFWTNGFGLPFQVRVNGFTFADLADAVRYVQRELECSAIEAENYIRALPPPEPTAFV
jgi:hypothetical protein